MIDLAELEQLHAASMSDSAGQERNAADVAFVTAAWDCVPALIAMARAAMMMRKHLSCCRSDDPIECETPMTCATIRNFDDAVRGIR